MLQDLTLYDIKPEAFVNYLRYYGEHFNRKLSEFASKLLNSKDYDKLKLEKLLLAHNVQLDGDELYDAVYVANFCKAKYYGSSISDEKHLVLYIQDTFSKDKDLIFNRFYADMAKQGIPIDWEEMI